MYHECTELCFMEMPSSKGRSSKVWIYEQVVPIISLILTAKRVFYVVEELLCCLLPHNISLTVSARHLYRLCILLGPLDVAFVQETGIIISRVRLVLYSWLQSSLLCALCLLLSALRFLL